MKNKLITFCVSMGIPFSSISVAGGNCTGICSNCTLVCAPGIVALFILLSKAMWGKCCKRGLEK